MFRQHDILRSFFLHFLACIAKHVENLLHVNLIISLQIPCVNCYHLPLCALLEKPVRAVKVYQARLSPRIKSALQNETYDPQRNFRTSIKRGIYELLDLRLHYAIPRWKMLRGVREKDAVVLASGYNV